MVKGPIIDQLEKWESTNGYLSKEREVFGELAHSLAKIGKIINKKIFKIGPYRVERYDWGVVVAKGYAEHWIRWNGEDIAYPDALYEVYEYLRNNLGTIMADLAHPIDERLAIQGERGWL